MINDKTIDKYICNEIVIEKSRFITHLLPTDTPEDAIKFINDIKKQHYNASHNCSAYVIAGNPALLQKASDDGEPLGTAGQPMLQALMQREMINLTAVVTRYFGGIKLGAGGLIRAYSTAVTSALDVTEIMVYEPVATAIIEITYNELNGFFHIRDTTKLFEILEQVYENNIIMHISCIETNIELLTEYLTAQLLRPIDITILAVEQRKVPLFNTNFMQQ
jgi:uncharacterized protein, YigZ family